MPKYASEQMLTGVVTLTSKQALALRDLGVKLEFRCPNPDCIQPVKPIGEGKDKDGVKYKAHFEHMTRNPKCHFGTGINSIEAIEKHLREGQIVKMERILGGTAYYGRAEAEFSNALDEEKDQNRREEMIKIYEELAEKLKNLSTKEREQALLNEIKRWKKERDAV
jgi:hypothetical protein